MIPRIILDVFLQLKHDDMFISSFIHKAEILSHSSSQIVSFLMLLRICSACFMIMIPQMIALSLSSLSSALFTLSQPHRSPKHRLQLRILLPHRRSPFRLKHSPALRYISFCWEYFFDLVSTLLQCVSDLLLALYQINFFVVDTLLVAIFR
ncbi:hypothetical protein BLNAU_4585 [Blattamonas nauphoetae]|uniref:Uncharacterized protein n=1 Tax=Blattamonas nauphoetae TaxID=2049346 RepID=A0ABQ9Y9J6_9EUKA|nr:hypothetical protein BLNAU_4585 [Blattamonas nauphoetae]